MCLVATTGPAVTVPRRSLSLCLSLRPSLRTGPAEPRRQDAGPGPQADSESGTDSESASSHGATQPADHTDSAGPAGLACRGPPAARGDSDATARPPATATPRAPRRRGFPRSRVRPPRAAGGSPNPPPPRPRRTTGAVSAVCRSPPHRSRSFACQDRDLAVGRGRLKRSRMPKA